MKYALFLLKMRQYRWSAALLTLLCVLSLTTNILLSSLLLNTHPTTVFVPTNTNTAFLYDGHFTPTYFEHMATFLSQRLFSFYPKSPSLHTLTALMHPQAKKDILDQHTSFITAYSAKHIQGFFAPQSTIFTPPNTVTVHGSMKVFVNTRFLREQPLNITLSFAVLHGRCLLKHLDATSITEPHNISDQEGDPLSKDTNTPVSHKYA